MQLTLTLSHTDRRQVLALIERASADQPASIAYITAQTGISAREIKRVVSAERAAHRLVMSSKVPPYGYWRPTNAAEIRKTAERLINEGKKLIFAGAGMFSADEFRQIVGQIRMELERSAE